MKKTFCTALLSLALAACLAGQSALAQNGYETKRPVIGGACTTCPWGALATVVVQAMKPYGYDVQQCFNCYHAESALIVAQRRHAPLLNAHDVEDLATTTRPEGEIDFGVTNAEFVKWANEGSHFYVDDGPQENLRLIANIELPNYVLVAAKEDLGITDLSQIRERKLPVRVLYFGGPAGDLILEHLGIPQEDVISWGGEFHNAMARDKPDFDLIISVVGTLSNYPEGRVWYEMSARHQLRFFGLPDELRQKLVADYGMEMVEVPRGYLKGMDHRIPTAGTSGNVVYGRDDMPEQFAYDVAKAMDEQRHLLRWTLLPFSYDTHTVANVEGLPLHPGAERYYREVGYIK